MKITREELAGALSRASLTVHDKDGLHRMAGCYRADTLITRANGRVLCPDEVALGLFSAIEAERRDSASGESADLAAQPQPAPELAATEALRWFAGDGQWLTCTDDGRLDLRAELLAVKSAVQAAFDAAARPVQPAPDRAVTVEALAAALADKHFPVIVGSGFESRTPARPYDLAVQLLSAIGTRLTDDAPQPAPDSDSQQRYIDQLHDLIRDVLMAWPAMLSEYRDRAGQLEVHDTDGQPFSQLAPRSASQFRRLAEQRPAPGDDASTATAVYLEAISILSAGLRDIRDANPDAPAGGYASDRAVLALSLADRVQPQSARSEIRTCYCGTTATVVPGVFPHPDCDGSVRREPQPAPELAAAMADLGELLAGVLAGMEVRVMDGDRSFASTLESPDRVAAEIIAALPPVSGLQQQPQPAPELPEPAVGIDPASAAYRIEAHAFNAVTRAVAPDMFVSLSDRQAIAQAVVAAVAPIIRADEREQQPAPDLGAAHADLENEIRIAVSLHCTGPGVPCDLCRRETDRAMKAVDGYARDVAQHERTREDK